MSANFCEPKTTLHSCSADFRIKMNYCFWMRRIYFSFARIHLLRRDQGLLFNRNLSSFLYHSWNGSGIFNILGTFFLQQFGYFQKLWKGNNIYKGTEIWIAASCRGYTIGPDHCFFIIYSFYCTLNLHNFSSEIR